jgi:hypothetical protein
MSTERRRKFEQEAVRSVELQREIEASDKVSFDAYLASYFSSD